MNQDLPAIAQWLVTFATDHQYLVYTVIVLVTVAEGPWLTLLCGVLLRLSHFGLVPVFVALMIGDLIGDATWYFIGRRYGLRFVSRYGRYFSVTERGIDRMTMLFHRHKYPVLFLSKISNGFGLSLVTLTAAGMVRIPFGIYLAVNLLGQFVWTSLLLAVGYFFTNLFVTVHSVMIRVSLLVALAALLIIGYRLWRHWRDRNVKMPPEIPRSCQDGDPLQ